MVLPHRHPADQRTGLAGRQFAGRHLADGLPDLHHLGPQMIMDGDQVAMVVPPAGVGHAGVVNAVDALRGLRTRPPSCLLYTSPSPRDGLLSRMPSSAC